MTANAEPHGSSTAPGGTERAGAPGGLDGRPHRLHHGGMPRIGFTLSELPAHVRRALAGLLALILLVAMVHGGRGTAPAHLSAPAAAPISATEPIAAGAPTPAPKRIAAALRAAGLHVHVVQSGGAALVTNAGHVADEGSVNVALMRPAAAGMRVTPPMITPPQACMTISARLGADA